MRKPFDGTFEQTQDWNDPRHRASYYQFGLLGHNGEDYACPAWTPILAPHSGIIREATFDAGGYGNYVKVENENETSVLAHFSKISVSVGQQVDEGQLVGYSGNTGNSTGAHLHWGFFRTKTRDRDNGFLGYIDQTDWLYPAIIAQPTAQTLNDQTVIPAALLNSDNFKITEDKEIQQLRGLLGDYGQYMKSHPTINVDTPPLPTVTVSTGSTSPVKAVKTAPDDESDLSTKTIEWPPILIRFWEWFKKL